MITVMTNLKLNASVLRTNYCFNSYCHFNGVILGASTTLGVRKLEMGDTDNGDPISASLTTHLSDMGIPKPKRARYGYVGYEATGDVNVSLVSDQENTIGPKTLPRKTSKGQQRQKIVFDRSTPFVYAKIRIDNVSGSFFAVDSIELFPVIMHNRRV